jgi:hypothetical protein
MLLLVIGIGVADVAATVWAGLRLQNKAEEVIKNGVDEIVQQAPSLIINALTPKEGENNG